MRSIAKLLIVIAGLAIGIEAQSNNCKDATSEILDRSFAAFQRSDANFHDFTTSDGVVLENKIEDVSAKSLVKCIDECVAKWPPADLPESDPETYYKQNYCRGVKRNHLSAKCSLYRVGPADIKLFNDPDDFSIIGGAVLGACSSAEAQRLIATDEERTPTCCDVWYRSIGVEV